jgi:hypothetical protein
MPLFDRVKAQAADLTKKAQEAGRAGQAKLDDLQARRRIDALYRDLGAAVYAEHGTQSTEESAGEISRLIGAIAVEQAAQDAEEAKEAEGTTASDSTVPEYHPAGAEDSASTD